MGITKFFKSFLDSGKVDIAGRYEILREAVSGTMSNFHMARDRQTDEIVGLKILDKAKTATYPLKNMELNEKNYIRFQGSGSSLKDYYREDNGNAVFNRDLLANVSFRKHDLVLGEVFNKFDLVLCRNVMIYFNQNLQNEVLKKFHEGLFKYGYLAIGSKESLIWCDYANRFIVVNNEEKIYKKIKD